MGTTSTARSFFQRQKSEHAVKTVQTDTNETRDNVSDAEMHSVPVVDHDNQMPNPNAQRGVQDMEAAALAWSKWTLLAIFLKYVFSTWSAQNMHHKMANRFLLTVFGVCTS
jgi:hypothetical protein